MDSKDKPSDIKLKPIKLVVKKPQKIKKKKDNSEINFKSKKSQSILNLFASIRYILIIVLLLFSVLLITNIVNELKDEPVSTPETVLASSSTSGIIANWQTTGGYTFTFTNDNTFYIYESGIETLNNYYVGKYEYIEDSDAITEIGYNSLEEFKKDFNLETYSNIYLIKLIPEKYFRDTKDIINRKIENNEKWTMIVVLTDNNNAIAYNKTLDIRYKLTRF